MMAYQQRFKLRGEATLRRTTRFRRVDRPAGELPRTSPNMMAMPAAKQKKDLAARAQHAQRGTLSFARQRNDFIELYADGDMKVP